MDLINTAFDFIQNPENSWVLYSIAAFMILDGFVLKVINKYLPKLHEKITQKPQSSAPTSFIVNLSAYITTLSGVVLAIVTYYFSHLQ